MHRLTTIQLTLGCFTLGFSGAVFASSGIPTLGEYPAPAGADRQSNLMHQFAAGMLRESADELRFRNFADLFLLAEEHQPPSGIAANVTAAVFGQGETRPGAPVFGGGGGSSLGTRMNGMPQPFGGVAAVAGAGPGNTWMPGRSGGFSGGGGGGGGGGFIVEGGEDDFPAQPPQADSGDPPGGDDNSGGNGPIVSFTDDHHNGDGHNGACCCCCPIADWGVISKADPPGGPLGNGGDGERDPGTAAIPVPAPLWIGLIGLAAVGWMRRRRFAM